MDARDTILVVDGDHALRESLCAYLVRQGMRATGAADGRAMRGALLGATVDLVVLDATAPGEGLALCAEIRAGRRHALPILMVAANDDRTDRVLGLEMGADDFLSKPFSPRELAARIRAVLRRTRMLPPAPSAAGAPAALGFGDWRVDTAARRLLGHGGEAVALGGAEYRLLRAFLDHPQRVLTRAQLLHLTHGADAAAFDRSIDLLVSRLRRRLDDGPRDPRYIKTLRNKGYVFSRQVDILAA
ncbi:winged helix-turn-helix domain-containing protein [Massilia sp. DD77]|uniref:winged helix-turn-helix domain-containing protein n=1 Tax=Massilia sp. DD77 TaxID=3109349 RepID=UPI002FFDB689